MAPIKVTNPSKPVEVLRHVSALDGIRGLAILLVLVCHLFWANIDTPNSIYNLIEKTTRAGWVGVDLFFVLSGFLITGILFDSISDGHYFRNFYSRRVLRIFPLYYAVVILLFLIFPAGLAGGPRMLVLLMLYLQNTPLWFNIPHITPPTSLIPHLWSLAAEEQFYLFWPIIIYLIKDRRKLLWVAGFGVVLAPIARTVMYAHGVPADEIYVMTVCRADTLLSGAWLALIVRGPARKKILQSAIYLFWPSLAVCLFIAWTSGIFGRESAPLIKYGYSFLALTMTTLVAMSLRPGSAMEAMMCTRGLRFLGRYSYGIYVIHWFVMRYLQETALPLLRIHVRSLVLYHLIAAPLMFSVCIFLAVLIFRFYESPFLRLKRHFNPQRSDRRNLPSATGG